MYSTTGSAQTGTAGPLHIIGRLPLNKLQGAGGPERLAGLRGPYGGISQQGEGEPWKN